MTTTQKIQRIALIRAQEALDNFRHAERKFAEAQEALEKMEAAYQDAVIACQNDGVEFKPLEWED